MKSESATGRIDTHIFGQAGTRFEAMDSLGLFHRLCEEALGGVDDLSVQWEATGELRPQPGGSGQVWLHLKARASVPLTCQRCLGAVQVGLEVDRDFRFVADEATASAEDDECEEDLLVDDRQFNLRELVEDELLMAMPLVPLHEICPVEVKLAVADEGFNEAGGDKPKPFAVLASLKKS